MNHASCLSVMIVATFLAAAPIAAAQDMRVSSRPKPGSSAHRGDIRGVEGRWYFNGQRDKPATIIASRLRGIEARNELGQFSRIEIENSSSIRALDWEQGMRGYVRRDSIEWTNGTTWTRRPSRAATPR